MELGRGTPQRCHRRARHPAGSADAAQRVPPAPDRRLAAAQAAPQGPGARALPPQGDHEADRRAAAARQARARRRGPGRRLLRAGGRSFGYERGERYQVSIKAGERVLLPAIREAAEDTLVIADGFSCQEQIAHGTDRRALHLAQVLQLAMRYGRDGPPGDHPEQAVLPLG